MKLLLWNCANHLTLDDSSGWDLSDLAQVNASLAHDLDEAKLKALDDFVLSHGDDEAEAATVSAAVNHGVWIADENPGREGYHNFCVFGVPVMVLHVKELEININ